MADVLGRPVGLEGIDDVEEALRGEDFPMDKQGLAYSVGEIEIRDSTGRTIPVRAVLDVVSQERFASVEEAVSAICAAADRAPDVG
ncbi:MAG: hypothetical protein AB1689_14800 [Thermodesulfobacteriota bacterium]